MSISIGAVAGGAPQTHAVTTTKPAESGEVPGAPDHDNDGDETGGAAAPAAPAAPASSAASGPNGVNVHA